MNSSIRVSLCIWMTILTAASYLPGQSSPQTSSSRPAASRRPIVLPNGTVQRPDGSTVAPPKADSSSGELPLPEKEKQQKNSSKDLEILVPEVPHPELLDQATKQHYLEALNGYYGYRISGYLHRQRVFAWQLFSSKLIFAVVVLLVFAGIYFAALQFHHGLRRETAPDTERAQGVAARSHDSDVTTISISSKEVKVSSPVLGVIILTISLAFFYLYLVYVYPVHDVF